MNLLVIGNGFDLAHGLKTSYKDYLNYVDNFKYFYQEMIERRNFSPNIEHCNDRDYVKFFLDLFVNAGSNTVLRGVVDEQINLILNNKWISYLSQVQTGDRWVDFEKEISRVVRVIDEVRLKIMADANKRDDKRLPIEKYQRHILQSFSVIEDNRFSAKDVSDIKKRMLDDLTS